jgi:hypothetical protein
MAMKNRLLRFTGFSMSWACLSTEAAEVHRILNELGLSFDGVIISNPLNFLSAEPIGSCRLFATLSRGQLETETYLQ